MGACCCSAAKRPPGGGGAAGGLPTAGVSKTCREFSHAALACGVASVSMRGWRSSQEDVANVRCRLVLKSGESAVGVAVFDGHSGAAAALFAARRLWERVAATEAWASGDVAAALTEGYLAVDRAMEAEGVRAGTTAVTAVVTRTAIYVAGVGDSRAILCRGGKELQLSVDHKPGLASEQERIRRCGGVIDRSDPRCPRVVVPGTNIGIAISRALGDFAFKKGSAGQTEQIMTAMPDVLTAARQDEDEFLVLASDGVWDVMDNHDMGMFLRACGRRSVETAAVTGEVGGALGSSGQQDPQEPAALEEAVAAEKLAAAMAAAAAAEAGEKGAAGAMEEAAAAAAAAASSSTAALQQNETLPEPPPPLRPGMAGVVGSPAAPSGHHMVLDRTKAKNSPFLTRCELLLDRCLELGTMDNCTVCVVDLRDCDEAAASPTVAGLGGGGGTRLLGETVDAALAVDNDSRRHHAAAATGAAAAMASSPLRSASACSSPGAGIAETTALLHCNGAGASDHSGAAAATGGGGDEEAAPLMAAAMVAAMPVRLGQVLRSVSSRGSLVSPPVAA
ncbi:unnamed protein product [Phaeothamnion confervicola]